VIYLESLIIACAILPGMAISRRQFFRGVVGKGETPQREQERKTNSLDTYVRTNLLPYDFPLTGEQTEEVLAAVRAAIQPVDGEDLFSYERRQQMYQIVEETVSPWRDEHSKAEEVRRDAAILVQEFLAVETTPEERVTLCQRFHIPYPAVLEEEIARQVQAWLAGLPNARVAACDAAALRDLVFSEIKSWC
jgi:hypothetical protein